jgi:predicted O-methyltransferase YrrM
MQMFSSLKTDQLAKTRANVPLIATHRCWSRIKPKEVLNTVELETSMSEQPNPGEILELLTEERRNRFKSAVSAVDYDFYGMWYSELLIFCLICKKTDCDTILESGRARGFSTKILSEYFSGTDVEIISIEHKKGTEADRVAKERLADADNVSLRYGDSRELMPEIADSSTGILIDGPKGDGALKLAIQLLESVEIPFVAIHDLHKQTFHRDLSELIFTDSLYTDNRILVNATYHFDKKVETWMESEKIEWWNEVYYGPNQSGIDDERSYGHTLGFFFGGERPLDKRVKQNYIEHIQEELSFAALVGKYLTHLQLYGGPVSSRLAVYATDLGRSLIGAKRKQ